jgi:hypothetical protein
MASGQAACRDCPNEQQRGKGRDTPPECPVRLELEAICRIQREDVLK